MSGSFAAPFSFPGAPATTPAIAPSPPAPTRFSTSGLAPGHFAHLGANLLQKKETFPSPSSPFLSPQTAPSPSTSPFSAPSAAATLTYKPLEAHKSKIADKLAALFSNPLSTPPDVTLISNDCTHFPAHLSILGLHTTWFASAPVDASSVKLTTSTKLISLSGHSSEATKAVLEYCYKYIYTHALDASVLFHFDIYLLARHVNMCELKIEVAKKIRTELGLGKLVARDVKGGYSMWNDTLPQLVKLVYGKTEKDDVLRRVIAAAVNNGMVKGPADLGVGVIRELMVAIPEFAGDLVEAGVRQSRSASMAGAGGGAGGFLSPSTSVFGKF